ncbi:MAG: metallophosphoesterase [Clostridiaceae bacterium]|nr:metallophosphoesterase [Clostridiaceae bacterium]
MKILRFLRTLIKGLFFLCCLFAALMIYMRYIEPRWLEVTHLDIESGDVSGSFRAVAFGDTHIGMGKDAEDMEKLADKINSLEPDAVFFLGDLFDNYSRYEGAENVVKALSKIKAEHKFAVRGNHDVGGGAELVYPELISEGGFTLLENKSVMLENGINIIGSANYIYYSPDVQGLCTEGFDLLLAHEPDLADAVGGVELQLSGHSHGGQIYIPFLLDRILPEGAKIYVRGLYEKPDGGKVYVNRGYGMSLWPLRLFARPEITVLTINGDKE